ncbi:MerR family transcriptional regulator [uncultured Alteromonas sp.]|uniref:MerR family transcriptional regulator n=1 Tax=uncultured Alteromonas sp. TaxID=179113 RepID=UPI0025D3D890|nr:MerR family transcriptional regulator [uncultured Alteromonas sp.]
MKIGELASRTGLAKSKIRFYEEKGLLNVVERTANGYRSYPPQAESILNLIVNGQQAGFSLDELRALLPQSNDNWQHDALMTALQQKVTDIEQLQQKLARNKAKLLSVIDTIAAKPDDMDCADNAKRVLSELSFSKNTP